MTTERGLGSLGRLAAVLLCCLSAALFFQGCKPKRPGAGLSGDKPKDAGTIVTAAWYDVPDESIAKKRAASDELTAAHNKLPFGTRVRVTHIANGKIVTVKITDRGIHNREVEIDLCQEAAAELGMVRKGFARVRMQVLL